MGLIEEVKAIETPSTRDLNWYYHNFPENKVAIQNILSEGIKCRKLLGRKCAGYNGIHFISLSKDIGYGESVSAFHSFRRCVMNIIIDGIEAKKCVRWPLIYFLANTRFPIRSSAFPDEFQFYKIITPDKFVGIQCPLYYWATGYEQEGDYQYFLDSFKDLIIVMKMLESPLPLYDYTRLDETHVHQINPDEFLEIYDDELGGLTSEEKRILKKH